MAFANGAERQDEAHRAVGHTRLIRVGHDTGIEERGGLVSVFLAEIGSDQQCPVADDRRVIADYALYLCVTLGEDGLHLCMVAGKVAHEIVQLDRDCRIAQFHHPTGDPLGAGVVAIRPRHIGPNDDARRIGPQNDQQAFDECGVRHVLTRRR